MKTLESNDIWEIAKTYGAGWLQNHLGYMELIYDDEQKKLQAEKEFSTKGFVVIQGPANWTEESVRKKIHRVFSSC